jgi:glycosyltransferase involved in cell wall biosynthesis
MNIIYIAFTTNQMDGVNKKVLSQYTCLKSLTASAKLMLVMTAAPSPEMVQAFPGDVEFLSFELQKTLSAKINRKIRLWQKILERVMGVSEPTVIYFRYPGADPFFWNALRRMKGNDRLTVVMEHQTKEREELKLVGLERAFIQERLFGGLARRTADGFVGVTKEICDYEVRLSGGKNQLCLVNGNGIDISSIPERKAPRFNRDRLDLLFLATFSVWHGLDRLVAGLAQYKGVPEIFLHVVGSGEALEVIEKQVRERGLEDKILFYGFLKGEELNGFFDFCHVAVGPIGIHRKSLEEGSALKLREYCARGIPFFSSSPDFDFPDASPLWMRIPGDDSPVEMENVVAFAKRALDIKDHTRELRSFAESRLDWKIKMEKLVEFLGEVQKRKRSNRN